MLQILKNFLFPRKCANCGRRGTYLCTSCQAKLEPAPDFCLVCDKPAIGGYTHPGCKKKGLAPERTLSCFLYRKKENPKEKTVAQKLIIALKYKGVKELGDLMAGLWIKDLSERGISFGEEALVVPVPSSFWGRARRGFNQAELLGKALADNLNLSYQEILAKKETLSQKDLKRYERKENVKEAFYLKKDVNIKGKDILLIDDVATTGSTLLEAAKPLKKAGARYVWCLTFAKD